MLKEVLEYAISVKHAFLGETRAVILDSGHAPVQRER
jgi:hypothetical protein